MRDREIKPLVIEPDLYEWKQAIYALDDEGPQDIYEEEMNKLIDKARWWCSENSSLRVYIGQPGISRIYEILISVIWLWDKLKGQINDVNEHTKECEYTVHHVILRLIDQLIF